MIDLIKKSLMAGLGTAAITREKAEQAVQEMVDQGKIKQQDAEELLKNIISTGEAEMEEMRKEWKKTVHNAMENMDLASRSDLEKLVQRLDELEKRVDLMEPKD